MLVKESDLWDIEADAKIRYTRVWFDEVVTEEEALKRFKNGDFKYFENFDEIEIIKINKGEPI